MHILIIFEKDVVRQELWSIMLENIFRIIKDNDLYYECIQSMGTPAFENF